MVGAATGSGTPAAGLPLVAGSVLGIVANPMSGRDIRRLVAQASVFPNVEKTNMVLRLIAAAGAIGVDRVLLSTDAMGVAGGVLRARDRRTASAGRWPDLDFVELDELTGTADDTRATVLAMRKQGAAAIVLLGGDGTVRAAAAESGDVPLLPLSTGTNNVFPEMWEATVAGTAAGLVGTGRVDPATSSYRAKVLHVQAGDVHEVALVDVCVTSVTHVGARALWQPETLHELYCCFAEPHSIGLSSIAGLLRPTARTDPNGVLVRLAGQGAAAHSVLAPIAPGVIATLRVRSVEPLRADEPQAVNRMAVPAGTVAVDGEREIEFGPSRPVTVTLTADGPRVLDVRSVLADAADRRLLVRNEPNQEIR